MMIKGKLVGLFFITMTCLGGTKLSAKEQGDIAPLDTVVRKKSSELSSANTALPDTAPATNHQGNTSHEHNCHLGLEKDAMGRGVTAEDGSVIYRIICDKDNKN